MVPQPTFYDPSEYDYPDEKINGLEAQIAYLKGRLAAIDRRIREIDAQRDAVIDHILDELNAQSRRDFIADTLCTASIDERGVCTACGATWEGEGIDHASDCDWLANHPEEEQ